MRQFHTICHEHVGNSKAFEHRINKNEYYYKQGARQGTYQHKYQLCLWRVVHSAFWSDDIEVERKESGEIEHFQDDWRPRNCQETNGHKTLHA